MRNYAESISKDTPGYDVLRPRRVPSFGAGSTSGYRTSDTRLRQLASHWRDRYHAWRHHPSARV
jgi:hypothetical protein